MAFTLVESMAATTLLVFIGASVWVVVDRCMISAADSTMRMRAFEIARENMEKLLGSDTVQETTEYGQSEKYPEIHWQSTIESFSDPISSRMWVQAVCSAEYIDVAGETKSVELTHWLTALTDEQSQQLLEGKEKQKQQLTQYLIETEDLAAQYAGVKVETIREWVKNGMPTSEGAYIKPWLDVYVATDGKPTPQDKQELIKRYPELGMPGQTSSRPAGESGVTEPDTGTAPSLPPPPPP
jgi:hypothetical protein